MIAGGLELIFVTIALLFGGVDGSNGAMTLELLQVNWPGRWVDTLGFASPQAEAVLLMLIGMLILIAATSLKLKILRRQSSKTAPQPPQQLEAAFSSQCVEYTQTEKE